MEDKGRGEAVGVKIWGSRIILGPYSAKSALESEELSMPTISEKHGGSRSYNAAMNPRPPIHERLSFQNFFGPGDEIYDA